MSAVPDETDQLRRQKAGAEKRLENLYRMVENGAADEFDLERMRDVKNQIRALNEKIAAAGNLQPVQITRDQIVKYWYRLMAELKMQNRPEIIRPVLQKIINKISVFPDHVHVSIGNVSDFSGHVGNSLALPAYPLIEFDIERKVA